MTTRRESLKLLGTAAAATLFPISSCSGNAGNEQTRFRYCLNTSTIRGQGLGLVKNIEVAAEAGYDGLELWVDDVKAYLAAGNNINELRNIIHSSSLAVEGAIGFAPWITDDPEVRRKGLIQMEEEMEMMAALDCPRIAAPPAGFHQRDDLDLLEAGERYRQVIAIGRKTGVMPMLEFWGASRSLYHLGQAMMIAAAADDPDVMILADVYHLFRGGSGFNGLKMISGNAIELFHMNDYPGDKPRQEQTDADRVYPGDGVAPMRQILSDLHEMGGVKVLSLELFNREYWERDALEVAETGLRKMKDLVASMQGR
jgi:2-keto-myo-inositol isomerase